MMKADPATDTVTFRGRGDRFAIVDTEFTVPFKMILAASMNVQAILAAKLYGMNTHLEVTVEPQAGAIPPGKDAGSVQGPGTPAVRLQ